jgi:hypothetical protein
MAVFSEIVTQRTQDEILEEHYQDLAAQGVDLEGLQEESLLRGLPWSAAKILAAGEETRVNIARGGLPSQAKTLSTTAWIELIGSDYYARDLDPATFSVGTMRAHATASASSNTIQAGQFVVRYGSGSTAILFENAEAFTPTLGSYVEVSFRAKVAGSSGNIGNNAILALVTSYPGFSVTNPPVGSTGTWLAARGRDKESAVKYADRLFARWADLSEGVSSERFARLVRLAFTSAGLTNPIARIYVDDSNPLGPGSVRLFLATDAGPASADEVARVQDYIDPRWSTGQGAFVAAAALSQSIAVTGTIKGPTNATTALTQASAALAALAPTYSIGGATVYIEQIRTALMNGVTGAVDVTLTLPAANTAITAGAIVSFTPVTLSVVP